jgi:hypothetical protein
MKLLVVFLISSFSLVAFSNEGCESRGPNVILLTFDGVRHQEFFKGTDKFHRHTIARSERGRLFPIFWSQHARGGMVLGRNQTYQIASSVSVSLPSYQALMLGHATDCKNNHCGPVKEETFLEKIRRELNLSTQEVASFASWEGMMDAVAKDANQITRFIYPEIKNEDFLDPAITLLQTKAMTDLPSWKESRKDHYTFEMGLQYLRKHCPRVLYLSLVDSDEYGHNDDYPGYIKSLRTYDTYLHRLISTLKEMGDYGKQTTLIVTTDHSRGQGINWKNHGTDDQTEKNVFLFATGRGVEKVGQSRHQGNHAQIRPTIEYLMGIAPEGAILPNIKIK